MLKTKRQIIYCVLIGFAIALIVAGFIATKSNDGLESPTKLLSLGEQYLLDLDYAQALVQFLKVIEIEPMNERAYIGAAEAYIALGQTDEAIAVLERGLNAMPDSATIKAILAELSPEPEAAPQNGPESVNHPESEQNESESYYEEMSSEQKRLLDQLEQAVRSHDYERASTIQSSAEYESLMQEIAENKSDRLMIYYPDDNSVVYVWVGEENGNHMDIYIGSEGAGHHVGSRYLDGWDNYVMQIADYTGGKANGPFSYEINAYDDRGFYRMTGNLTNGVCSARDVVFTFSNGDAFQTDWDGEYTFPDWPG